MQRAHTLKKLLQIIGLPSLTAWADAADVPRQRIYQARQGEPLSARNARNLAAAASLPEATVRRLLRGGPRSGSAAT